MHGNIPYTFDYWFDPVAHLPLLTKELHGLGASHGKMPPPPSSWMVSSILKDDDDD